MKKEEFEIEYVEVELNNTQERLNKAFRIILEPTLNEASPLTGQQNYLSFEKKI